MITQEDWIRLKAEEERRVFEQSSELQMSGNPRWYERIRMTGYIQYKYNMAPTNRLFDNPLGDSFGDQQGNEFYIRRMRLVFQRRRTRSPTPSSPTPTAPRSASKVAPA